MTKKLEVGQKVVFVKKQFRQDRSVNDAVVMKVGRKYATIVIIGQYKREIRIELEGLTDCDSNYGGRVYLSRDEYMAERNHYDAVAAIHRALYLDRNILSRAKTATLLQVAELLGIDMSKLGDKQDD